MLSKQQILNRFHRGDQSEKYRAKMDELESLEEDVKDLESDLEEAEGKVDSAKIKQAIQRLRGQQAGLLYELTLIVDPEYDSKTEVDERTEFEKAM